MKSIRSLLLATALIIGGVNFVEAQAQLVKDYAFVMEIPSVITMEASPAHLYVLSDTEGMVVFRTRPDTLQWLYSSTGMEQRGNTATADIRFAYLFGNSRRLTVLEPTSVLGVYSSTLLPARPRDAKRIDQNLYVAMGEKGLGQLSLRTPSSVDSTVNLIERSRLKDETLMDLEASADQLFALASGNTIMVFDESDESVRLNREINLDQHIDAIFLVDNILYGTDRQGNIFEVDNSGTLSKLGTINEPVTKIEAWKDWLIFRGSSNRVWTSYQNRSPVIWKDDREAGNHIVAIKDELWLCEYNQISRVTVRNASAQAEKKGTRPATSVTGQLSIQDIPNKTIPNTKPLLFTINLEKNFPLNAVQFSYQSDIENARIRGNSFYWKPTSDDIGQHRFKIVATATDGQTDSTSFTVDVRSFNAPPRFAPIRPTTIPVGEEFTLPISATDPDGMSPDLIRFLGVDLPDGAEINEKTGRFRWTPTARQVGENKFRVIATDQYGAASSADIVLEVVEQRGGSESETGN